VRPDRFAGGAQSIPLTVASSRTWRGSQGSAAPVPSGRTLRIPQEGYSVNAEGSDNLHCGHRFSPMDQTSL